jgi:hypothetical protein
MATMEIQTHGKTMVQKLTRRKLTVRPNDPLYYLYDALGTTAAITNMNAGIIDNNRFASFGEPLSPVAKNSRLTNSPWGYTGESHDIKQAVVKKTPVF